VTSTTTGRDRIRPSEAVAGLLAAGALFLGFMELVYRPFRLAPLAVVLLLIAAVMGNREQQGLVKTGFAVVGICFVAGAAIQILVRHPLF
jgi:hypothetical protein